MSREPFNPEAFLAELDALGYPKVGELLASGRWGKVGPKYELVQEWRHQRQRADSLAVEAEQTKIAREAKDAAERSAAASERSATAAEAATAKASLALVVTLIVAAASILVQAILAYVKPS